MAYWPPQLPSPSLPGYGLEPQPAFTRTDMDAGPARQRRRFTQAPTEITVQLVMTREQMAIFEAWFEHRIASGADWFDAPLDNGQGVTTVECRFIEPWRSQPLGLGRHAVTARWETVQRPVMTNAELVAAGVP